MKRRQLLAGLAATVPGLAATALLPRPASAAGAAGPFRPDWDSLAAYRTPDWFRNAKFGIWAHWGPQCEPEFGDWYARNMYKEGSDAYRYHLQKYGHPSKVGFKDVTEGSVPSDASPMRPDFVAAVTKAIHSVYPGVPVFPSMASGASDSMWFRHYGVASYGASPTFIKESEDFSHGLNERTPISNIGPAIDYYLSLIPDLSK